MRIKLVLAASTLLSTFLIAMILSVTSHMRTIIDSAQASSTRVERQFIAREASESPRGFDNERAGDKHRGRSGRPAQFVAQIA